MPSLRCPRCKTAMLPETTATQTAATVSDVVVRPMRMARTIGAIGSQPEQRVSNASLPEEARLQLKQEQNRLLEEAQKQIQKDRQDAEAALQQFREQKTAEAEATAKAIIEEAQQTAEKIRTEAENVATEAKEEAKNAVLQKSESFEQQLLEQKKADIDQIARQNQFRFWRLNAYVILLLLTLISAIKSNGNTLVAALSGCAAALSLALACIAVYNLRACLVLLKTEKNSLAEPQPSTPSPAFMSAAEPLPQQSPSMQPQSGTNRKIFLSSTKKTPSKPFFIKKKSVDSN